MIYKKQKYYECIIPKQNKNAFYELIAGQDLFGFIVIRRWGRIGTKGQPKKKQRFQDEKKMFAEFTRIHQARIKHQYVPIIQSKRNLEL